jgi:hypothetical protein
MKIRNINFWRRAASRMSTESPALKNRGSYLLLVTRWLDAKGRRALAYAATAKEHHVLGALRKQNIPILRIDPQLRKQDTFAIATIAAFLGMKTAFT